MAKKTASFLGANTPKGFVSFFDELYNPYNDADAYIIKGGPGTGKSTFMKGIAEKYEKCGYATEKVYCSSDPASLDGLIVPEKNFSICDGTAPHVMEPRFPGVAENIISTGEFWDIKKLRKSGDEIRKLFFENSLCHRKSSKYLAAAGHIDMQSRAVAQRYIKTEKIDSFTSRFIHRELQRKEKTVPGERQRRFLEAFTPKGNIFLADTVAALCPRIIGIDDAEGVVSSLVTQQIGEGAIRNGYRVIFCHCPMNPQESEHIIIPEKGIAVVRLYGASKEIACDRVIHTGRFMNDGFRDNRLVLKFNERVKQELVAESIRSLRNAKTIHDSLEKIYIDAMDFERLNEFYDNFITRLFS